MSGREIEGNIDQIVAVSQFMGVDEAHEMCQYIRLKYIYCLCDLTKYQVKNVSVCM